MTSPHPTLRPDQSPAVSLGTPPAPDRVWIPGGTFRMGSDRHYPEEAAAHRVTVDGFWMDRFPVTNARFREYLANTWQGDFPWQNQQLDGYEYTSPVDAFPPNGYGLYDMIANVWEWTSDWYRPRHPIEQVKACCIPRNPRGGTAPQSYDPRDPRTRIPRKVLKGGSHLCAPNYCRRYRPAARFPEPIDTSASHVGFRCISRVPER